jgi:hypothetical protein
VKLLLGQHRPDRVDQTEHPDAEDRVGVSFQHGFEREEFVAQLLLK